MNIENTKTQMLKGILEYCILSIIQKQDVYASEIIEEFNKSQLEVVEGTIYPILSRLKNSEYLTYYWQESNAGPPRKYFKITDAGKLFYKELEFAWKQIEHAINTINQSISK